MNIKYQKWQELTSGVCHTECSSFLGKGLRDIPAECVPVPYVTSHQWSIHRDTGSICWGKAEVCKKFWTFREDHMSIVRSWTQVDALKTISPAHSLSPHISCGEFDKTTRWAGLKVLWTVAKGYVSVVQQDCHVTYMPKWKGSECPGSTSHYITTTGFHLVQAASPVSLLSRSSSAQLLSRMQTLSQL